MVDRPLTFLRSLRPWLERHGEKLGDGVLLFLALNAGRLLPLLPVTPFMAQGIALLAYGVLTSPRTSPAGGLWMRYARQLPSLLGTALIASLVVGWWFDPPRTHAWLAAVWLGLTLLTRVVRLLPLQRIFARLTSRRIDLALGDVALLAWFTHVAPAWSLHPGPAWSAVGMLAGGWLLLHTFVPPVTALRAAPRLLAAISTLPLALIWAWLGSADPAGPLFVFAAWLAVGLIVYRLAATRWASADHSGPSEIFRWLGLLGVTASLFAPFARAGRHGAGDSLYYGTVLADALTQLRHGVFPLFVGQSEFQFNGSVMPIRVAPGFQHLGGLVDLLTAQRLGPLAVQNLLITLIGILGVFITYACLRRLRCPPSAATALTLLYLTCPGALGLAFNTDLYMSWMTFPLVTPVLMYSLLSYLEPRRRVFAGLGFFLGLTWWMHPPVALWLTFVAALLQVGRLVLRRPALRPALAELTLGAVCFLVPVAYPVISTVGFPADPTLASSTAMSGTVSDRLALDIFQALQATTPAAWLPLSHEGRALGDYQLGYGLLAIALLLAGSWFSLRAELRLMHGLSGLLLLLLLPLPWLSVHLWQLFPQTVLELTNVWVMQRFYLLLAGILTIAAAAWLARKPAPFVHVVLGVAGCWSLAEAIKFPRGSWAATTPDSYTASALLPENITLTRFSYGLFARRPDYFSHGVVDPVLENRLLAGDRRTVLRANSHAALAQARPATTSVHTFIHVDDLLTLTPALALQPGRHYLVELIPPAGPFPAGTLILRGTSLRRAYALPAAGEARAFGVGDVHPPFFPLHSSASATEFVTSLLVPADPAQTAAWAGQVTLRLTAYDPAVLPVNVQGWMPYRATVHAPEAAWLETPRMYQSGYVANVDGAPVPVERSAEGLAAVPVPAGTSTVELRYVAPLGLQLAFWLSFTGIMTGAVTGLVLLGRSFRSPPAGDATPAAVPR